MREEVVRGVRFLTRKASKKSDWVLYPDWETWIGWYLLTTELPRRKTWSGLRKCIMEGTRSGNLVGAVHSGNLIPEVQKVQKGHPNADMVEYHNTGKNSLKGASERDKKNLLICIVVILDRLKELDR